MAICGEIVGCILKTQRVHNIIKLVKHFHTLESLQIVIGLLIRKPVLPTELTDGSNNIFYFVADIDIVHSLPIFLQK